MLARLFAGILLAVVGCAPPPEPPVDATPAADAPCAAHGVLGAVCPKCNPALAAVFQAKGDWCGEHGFPESFCPICHPERGGQPAADVSDDGVPAHGTKIRFRTLETARLAGIETVVAAEALRGETVTAVARLVYDAANVAWASAPVPGVVSEIHADVGEAVTRGNSLALIQSAEVGVNRSQAEAARSRVAFAEVSLARRRDLLAAGVTSQVEFEEAEQALTLAQAELAAAESPLRLAGSGNATTMSLLAPLSGEVTRRDVSLGMGVEAGAHLFEIVEASVLWAELDVAEVDLERIAVGSTVALTFGTRVVEGTVAYVAPTLSVTTRTAMARVPINNADRRLRANMYGTARIAGSGATLSVTVPASAVQRVGGVDLAFVRLSEDQFELRRLVVRSNDGLEATLASGVNAGETVVTAGSFMLKTETLKDRIGAGCCDVE